MPIITLTKKLSCGLSYVLLSAAAGAIAFPLSKAFRYGIDENNYHVYT